MLDRDLATLYGVETKQTELFFEIIANLLEFFQNILEEAP